MLPHCLAESHGANMSELMERYRSAGFGIIATSATTLTLAACVALILQSGLRLHHPGLALATGSTFETVVWVAWLALGVSMIVLVYGCWKDVLTRWVAGAFLIFLAIDLINRRIPDVISSEHPWAVKLLVGAGSFAGTIFVAGLPIIFRRMTLLVRDASRSRDNEMRLIAAAESSTDSVILFESVRNADAAICDFKFIFLNGNAERLIRNPRKRVLGKNLIDIFPAFRDADHFERYCQVVETGEPALIEITSNMLQSEGGPGRFQIQVVKLADGIATTISDVTRRHQHVGSPGTELEFAL